MSDVRYFSNGTEGCAWMANWCDRCTHDHDEMHVQQVGPGCEHTANLYFGHYDPVFTRQDPLEFAGWRCIMFSRCQCDRGPDDPGVEPAPIPDPNQGALFDVDALAPGVWRDVVLDTFPVGVSV